MPGAEQESGAPAMLAVIGGSGLYELFDDSETVQIDTPYGTAVDVSVGSIGGRQVVFLPRHGRDHSLPPHRIDARATIWALASIGVRALISTAAVGSLNPALPVGTICVAGPARRSHARARGHVLRRRRGAASAVRRSVRHSTCGRWRSPPARRSSTGRPSSSSRGRASPPAPNPQINRAAGSTWST